VLPCLFQRLHFSSSTVSTTPPQSVVQTSIIFFNHQSYHHFNSTCIAPSSEYKVPADVKAAGFGICAEELSSIVEGHDVKKLKSHGGVQGLASKLSTSESDGLATSADKLSTRRGVFGVNKFAEAESRGFLVFVWEALQDMTLMILAVCAFVSLMVGIATEGWPKGAHDGLGIVASILLVVFVTASSDYRQSLQFKDLDKEKKKITVTRKETTEIKQADASGESRTIKEIGRASSREKD